MIQKFIEAFEEVRSPKIQTNADLNSWKARTINIVTRVYGLNSKQEEQIKNIKYTVGISWGVVGGPSGGGGNNARDCTKQASDLVSSFIYDLNTFGIPEKKEQYLKNGINISVNQNQTVNVNVIWESVMDELTGSQLKELKEVINEEIPKEEKKIKVINKISSFGKDLAANILASIITNPAIFGS